MLNLSGISNTINLQNQQPHQQQQRRNSEMNQQQLPPVYGQLQQQPSHQQHQQQQQQHGATINNSYAPSEIIGGGTSSETIFDDEVPVHLRNMDREEVVQSLGVCVQVVKSGPYRQIHLRITDPKDPFFLYTMVLVEDDYGKFKERNELHVDFGGFPRDLVQMLVASRNNNNGDNSTHQQQQNNNNNHLASHQNNNNNNNSQHFGANDMSTFSTTANSAPQLTVLSFIIANGNDAQATLRILEKTAFRSIEHLSLIMAKQGDVGQKQYLAERFRYFLRAYQLCENQRGNENEHFAKQVSELSIGIEQLRNERDQLRQMNALQASEHKAELASAIDRLRSTSEEHSRNSQSEHEGQISALSKQHQQQQRRNQNEIDNLQARLQQAGQKIEELESERLRLSTDLAQKTESLAASSQEGLRLKEKIDELASFKKTATREKNELDMAAVASTERLKHMTELLKHRDEEVSQLRRLGDSNEAALRRANEQLDATRKKLDDTEQSLAKAHHIIATQLQAQKTFKEKEKALLAQVKSAEKTAQDKSMEYERVKLETSADREKTATLTSRVAELKEQLKRAEEQNGNLANDLKQSQEALLHLGRSSSGIGGNGPASLGGSGRMYTSMMAGQGASSRAAAYMTNQSNNNNNTSAAAAANENTNPATNLNLGSGGLSSSTFAPAPITLFREFAKGNNNSGNNNNNNNNVSTSAIGQPNSMTMMSSSGIGGGYQSSYAGKYTSNTTSAARPSSSSRADPMSMLRNTAAGGTSGNNTPGVSSAYFPSN